MFRFWINLIGLRFQKHLFLDAAKKDENLSAFLSFSPVYRWEVDEYDDSYEVRFIDLRYRSKDYYPLSLLFNLIRI